MGAIVFYSMPLISCLLVVFVAFWLMQSWSERNKITNEIAKLKNTLDFKRKWGWSLLIISAANLIDLEVPFPFPLVGAWSFYFSVMVAIPGTVMLILFYRPKVNEFLVLAEKTHGLLTQVVIMTKLGLPQDLVEKTFRKMLNTGLLIVLNPSETKLPKLIFLVPTYSGRAPAAATPGQPAPDNNAGRDDQAVRDDHQDLAEMGVDELNRRILEGTLNLGRSGRPVRP